MCGRPEPDEVKNSPKPSSVIYFFCIFYAHVHPMVPCMGQRETEAYNGWDQPVKADPHLSPGKNIDLYWAVEHKIPEP